MYLIMYTIIQVGQICLAHPPAILTLAPALAPSRCPLSTCSLPATGSPCLRRPRALAGAGPAPPAATSPLRLLPPPPTPRPCSDGLAPLRRPRPNRHRLVPVCSAAGCPRRRSADAPQAARTLHRRLPAWPPSPIRKHASSLAGGTAVVPNPPHASPSAAGAAIPQSERGAPAPPLAACAAAAPSTRAHSAVAYCAAVAPARAAMRPLRRGLQPTSRRRR